MTANSEDNIGNHKKETYFEYYIKKYQLWISITISLFILMNIVALFVSTIFDFSTIFFYFGIILILFALIACIFIWFEANYFWALVGSIIFGLTPMIELIIHLSKVAMNTLSIILAIISLIVAVILFVLPFILVYIRKKKG